ncbi:hypothetical protein Tsubulata_000587 [Turnera subulata]|uniref:RecQ-mediated genome instability protein 1 n=1 Tax=Turnera subulata TaxID=218843 RepID=A0A9Q0GID9_9ROSI|nr:hypothetical protein Tsubulata_000587 [Turnera subulata]
MGRRRLRLSNYSDEEEHEQQPPSPPPPPPPPPQQQQQTSNSNPNPTLPEPLPISDEEFIDISDSPSPPSPQPEPASANVFNQPPPQNPPASTGCPIGDFLLNMGLSLKREWLDSCLRGLESSGRRLNGVDVTAKAKLCFEQFLFSDMNHCGGGLLPPSVESMHLVDLPGPFILQVDEVVNIGCPIKGRYQEAQPGQKRCLKLSMTDGVQRVFGMEYRPIKDLKVLAPAGFKVAICNVHVRHGLLMLVPEALVVLGGVVDELEAGRQRLVFEVNKPPRGKRSRTGVIPPLAARATLAAWPPNGLNVPETDSSANVQQQSNGSVNVCIRPNRTANLPVHTDTSTLRGETSFQAGEGPNVVAPANGANQNSTEGFSIPRRADESMLNQSTATVASAIEEMHIDTPGSRANAVSVQHSSAVSDNVNFHMVDEFEHPLVLAGAQENPFTYLATLSARWAAVKDRDPFVRGKVKGFLTGVKGFQYKRRATYELQVYIDDGSLISEILIDHNVVQKGIGYSPEEVTAALSSPDKKQVSDMKETLRRFQVFLANFEGTMVVEINGISPLPVALEMNQGCPASDAWLLMRRLKSLATSQTAQHHMPDPIELSP